MRRPIGTLVFALVASVLHAGGVQTRIVGRVVDEKGTPLRTAQVRVRGKQSSRTAPVAFNGTFEILLDSEEFSVIADVTAPGFEKRNRTLVVANGVADAGTLTMSATRSLSLTGLTISQSGEAKRNHLDVFARNESDKPIIVTSVRVQGMRKLETSCLDAHPGLLFTIDDQLWAGRVATAVATTDAFDSVAAEGMFLELGCGQQQLDVTLPYSFSLAGGEQTKLRVAVPAKLRAKERNAMSVVQLEEFALVTMSMHLSDGRDVVVKREVAAHK